MQLLKNILVENRKNKYRYIFNTMILQFVMLNIAIFILNMFFKLILLLSNQNNLTLDNFFEILFNPFGFIGIVIYLFVLVSLLFFEFNYLVNMILGNRSLDLKNILRKIKEIMDLDFIMLLIYFVLMIPFANLGLSSFLTEDIYIPKFITGEVLKTNTGMILIIVISLMLLILNYFLIFTLPLIMINNDSVFANMKKSIKLAKKYVFKIISNFFVFEIILILILSIIPTLIYVLIYLFNASNILLLNTLLLSIIRFSQFILIAYTKLVIISILINILKEENLVKSINIPQGKSKLFKGFTYIFLLGYFFVSFGYNYNLLVNNKLNKNIKIVAHRGYTKNAVENTLKAIEEAYKNGADLVEIDIYLTKDNKFVLSHDNNLKRLAKINNKISDMNYSELKDVNIYQNRMVDKIPTFEQAVNLAKEKNIQLLVELKLHGKEPKNYLDMLIDEFNRLKINDFPVMSIDLKLVEELEKKASYLKTGHVIPFQFGLFVENDIDFYVLEDFSYTSTLNVEDKELYIFTINDDALMRKYLQSNVYGIISDKLEKIEINKKKLEKEDSYLKKVIRIIGII